jgi:hypothetical protein
MTQLGAAKGHSFRDAGGQAPCSGPAGHTAQFNLTDTRIGSCIQQITRENWNMESNNCVTGECQFCGPALQFRQQKLPSPVPTRVRFQ